MTALRIQKLEVENCEETIQRAYFEWGRGWEKDSPELTWADAAPEQRRATALRGYALYDGLAPLGGNRLGPLEVYASIGVNSRVILHDAVRFMRRADEAMSLLARIPDHARLEDATEDQVAAAAELIDLLASEPHIGWGKATKVLYLKRPAFIPVLDSVVSDFLWKNLPHLLTGQSPAELVLSAYQLLLVARSQPLREIHAALARGGFNLNTARILNYLIWIEWKQHTEGEPLMQEQQPNGHDPQSSTVVHDANTGPTLDILAQVFQPYFNKWVEIKNGESANEQKLLDYDHVLLRESEDHRFYVISAALVLGAGIVGAEFWAIFSGHEAVGADLIKTVVLGGGGFGAGYRGGRKHD